MADIAIDIITGSVIVFPLLFVAGYILSSMFKLRFFERIVFSFLISIAVATTVQMVLGIIGVPISLISFIVILIAASAAMSAYRILKNRGKYEVEAIFYDSQLFHEGKGVIDHLLATPHKFVLYIVPGTVFVLYFAAIAYTFPFTTNGDGLTHTIITSEISSRKAILEFFPYYITGAENGGFQHVPIDYPLSFHVFMAAIWEAGGLYFLKLMPAFFALLTYMTSFLIMRKFTTNWAGIAAAMVPFVIVERLVQPVLQEPMLLPFSLAAIYSYVNMLEGGPNRKQWIILTGVMLAFAAAIKQQGIILMLVILLHYAIYNAVVYAKTRRITRTQLAGCLFIPVMIVVVMPSFIEMYQRNGTPLGTDVPMLRGLPFIDPKYVASDESAQVLSQRLAYWFSYNGIQEPFFQMFSYPICIGYCDATTVVVAAIFILALAGSAIFATHKNNGRHFIAVLAAVLIGEVVTAFIQTDYVGQYHQVGLAMVVFLSFVGVLALFRYFAKISSIRSYVLVPALALMILSAAFLAYSGFSTVHANSWGAPKGRLTADIQTEYVDAGRYMRTKLPSDAIVLGAEAGIQFYGKRQMLWIHSIGGDRVPLIFETTDVIKSLTWMKNYGVEYIFIDTRQTQWFGVSDYIYPFGLLPNLEKFDNFNRLYNSTSGRLLLYQVDYCPPPNTDRLVTLFESGTVSRWQEVVSNNIESSVSTIEGSANVILQGSGQNGQYARFEAPTGEITTNDSTTITIEWHKSSSRQITGAVELLGGDRPYTIFLDNVAEGKTSELLPEGLKFNRVSLDVSLADGSTDTGFFIFDNVSLESTGSPCV